MTVRWSSGLSPENTGPISNSATSAKPRLAFRPAASIRFGRMDGRMQSSSAAIGWSRTSAGGPPPNRSAMARGMNDQVTASS